MIEPRASLVVAAFDMPRELPRTIRSLSPAMQRNVGRDDYEIIVVDNGSSRPFDDAECRRWGANLRILRFPPSSPSPAAALNAGIKAARGELIGALIDGARLASPGVVSMALKASRLAERAVIATIGFHLGDRLQHLSIQDGYDQAAEDRLLDSVDWTADGYRLFRISVLAGASHGGWFAPIGESNALFMRRALWEELGGFHERFRSAGGGLVNADLFSRAVGLPGAEVITLLGEGTFHQVHGGTATNATRDVFTGFHAEYQAIRGRRFRGPVYRSAYFGTAPESALSSIAVAAQTAADRLAEARAAKVAK
jgi:glycosyltransferase involved in cell wall biosynthesis